MKMSSEERQALVDELLDIIEQRSRIQVDEDKYKGHPVLLISDGDDDKYPLKMGVQKAEKALKALPELLYFVKMHGKAGRGGREG